MFEKIITTAARIVIICLAAEAVREIWNDKEEEGKKEENK